MSDDWELLARYRNSDDQEAFAELVRRYVDMVWSVGFRKTGDRDLAQDIAQVVFSDLARKAGKLPPHANLPGWLYCAACYAGSRTARDSARRHARETEAFQMQSQQVPDEPDESQAADLLPILDEAMSSLGEADRETILLRFFCKRSLAEIGHALGVSEDAAQKRVARALDRLRRRLQRRGLAASTGAVLVVLGTAGSQAAPVGTVAALVTSSIVATLGAPTPASATTLLAGVSSLSAMKVPLVLTALVAVTATAPLVIQQRQVSAALAENWRLQAQAAQEPLWRDAVAERGDPRQSIVGELEQLRKNHQELLQLQGEVAGFNSEEVRAKSEWLRRLERTRADLTAAQEATGRIEENIASEELHTKRTDDLKQLGLAARIVEMEHQDTFPTTFEALTNSTGGLDFGPYEYVQHGRPLTEADGDLILFREKEARRLPNGKWRRSYTIVDGSVRTIDSDTGDYQQWERPLVAQPGPANMAGSER